MSCLLDCHFRDGSDLAAKSLSHSNKLTRCSTHVTEKPEVHQNVTDLENTKTLDYVSRRRIGELDGQCRRYVLLREKNLVQLMLSIYCFAKTLTLSYKYDDGSLKMRRPLGFSLSSKSIIALSTEL